MFLRVCLILLLFVSFHVGAQNPKLSDFKYNVFSQFGEDGIIEKIFEVIGVESKTCIEFGAWDGFFCSNTANLFSKKGWKAILIECNKNKFNTLVNNVNGYDCTCICEAIGIGNSSLESVLLRNSIPFSQIDLLSIDIDGNDYYVFDSLDLMRPRVIVCEYNPTLPAHLSIYAKYDDIGTSWGFGCSVGALNTVAKQKGYSLVALTDCNAFFVRSEYIDLFASFEISLNQIRIDDYLLYAITDFSGNYAIVSQKKSAPFGFRRSLKEPVLGNVHVFTPTQ